MTRKRRNGRRRVRGSDGKLYDRKKQADNGYQAHENRMQTAARRTRWRSRGAIGWLIGLITSLASGLLGATTGLITALVVRPVKMILSTSGSLLKGGTSRISGRRRRGR